MKVFISGVSGTGKSTLLKELEKRGCVVIGLDETPGLCAWYEKETSKKVTEEVALDQEFIQSHDWLCGEEELFSLIDDSKDPVFVLGSVSNQFDFLNRFDGVFFLKTSSEVIIERLNARDDNPFGKDESAQNEILDWYKRFEGKMLEYGAKSLDAEQPIEKVADELLKKVHFGLQ